MAAPTDTELEWHLQVAEDLKEGVTTPGFFLWIRVMPEEGAPLDPEAKGRTNIATKVNSALRGIEPSDTVSEFEVAEGPVQVKVAAIAKRPQTIGPSLVANPVPATAFFPDASV